jgi:hypothetical protein
MFIVGGALVGVFVSNASNCLNDSSYSYDSYSYTYDNIGCTSKYNGQFYGAVACFIIGGVCKLIAWVLLIMYCVRRRRAHQEAANAQYHTVPMGPYTVPGPYGQPQYPPQYPQGPQPMYPNTAYHGQAPVSKELAAAQYA